MVSNIETGGPGASGGYRNVLVDGRFFLEELSSSTFQPPFGPSVDSLCHPWFTATHLSYRFRIFETSATALCGTTGIYLASSFQDLETKQNVVATHGFRGVFHVWWLRPPFIDDFPSYKPPFLGDFMDFPLARVCGNSVFWSKPGCPATC